MDKMKITLHYIFSCLLGVVTQFHGIGYETVTRQREIHTHQHIKKFSRVDNSLFTAFGAAVRPAVQ